jgi:arginine-tRNA-protein transferase
LERIQYASPPQAHLPINYGSYHHLYRVDGQLIAMAVLDILPDCVSSVYFMYDRSWQEFSLGKVIDLFVHRLGHSPWDRVAECTS